MIFLESPWPILGIGIAIVAVLGILLLQTGRSKFLWGIVGTVIFVLIGLAVEHFVVTERELVEHTIDSGVAAVRANDLQAMLACISPSATKPQADARLIHSMFVVTKANISDLEVTINRLTSPPSAKATFLAVCTVRGRSGEELGGGTLCHVTVTLHREDDHWLVSDYTIAEWNSPR
jgi:hypothetical protein